MAETLPVPKGNGLAIVAAAVRDGEFRCQNANEIIAANTATAHRYLTRDKKDGNLFRPGEFAIDMLDRARAIGKLAADEPAIVRERKVAVARDPQTIHAGNRLRNLDEGTVLALVAAFKEYGQQQPIVVYGKETDATVTLGAGGHNRPWIERSKSTVKGGRLFIVGVDGIKSNIMGRLTRPRSMRFSKDLAPVWYEQVAGERMEITYKRGQTVRQFVPVPGRRHEALDCTVYAFAARQMVNANWAHREGELSTPPEMVPPPSKPQIATSDWL